MTTEEKIKPLLEEVVKIIRQNSFIEQYQNKATDQECLGIAMAKYFEWDSRIIKLAYEMFEDANFHSINRLLQRPFAKYL